MKFVSSEFIDNNTVKVTLSGSAEELEAAAQAAYERTGKNYHLKGLEKGQVAERAAIEAERGEHTFWYDAINDIMDRDADGIVAEEVKKQNQETFGSTHYDLVSVNKADGFVATATYALKPQLTLDQYTGFVVKSVPKAISEAQVDDQMKMLQRIHAENVPHKGPAVKNDIVTIDFTGKINGEAFKGGEAKGRKLTLGSHSFIPGFEEGIIGHEAGDEFYVKATFPATYGSKDLAGREAVFSIVLHEVCQKVQPSLNADFAKKYGHVDTIEEYRAAQRAVLEKNARTGADNKAHTEIMKMLAGAVKGDIAPVILEEFYNRDLQVFQYQLQMQGATLPQYLQMAKQTKEEFYASVRENSERQLRLRFAYEIIGEKEGIAPTDAEVDAEMHARAERAKKPYEEYIEKNKPENVRMGMLSKAAQKFVFDHSTIEECDPQ